MRGPVFPLLWLVGVLLLLVQEAAGSVPGEAHIVQACLAAIERAERVYGIPPHLLESVALVESGRTFEGSSSCFPWPWTVAVNGKGRYFSSKSEAIAAVRKLQARGIRNIDVGCMQVNLLHHPHAFRSLHEAFDIVKNIAYAAKFLRALQEQHISWRKAVGCYHSYTAEFHFPYRQRVFETWTRIRQRTPLGPPTGRARPLWASACTSFPRRGPKGVRPAASRSERPMSAFYASLNRRTSGKLYHASLCRNHSQLY